MTSDYWVPLFLRTSKSRSLVIRPTSVCSLVGKFSSFSNPLYSSFLKLLPYLIKYFCYLLLVITFKCYSQRCLKPILIWLRTSNFELGRWKPERSSFPFFGLQLFTCCSYIFAPASSGFSLRPSVEKGLCSQALARVATEGKWRQSARGRIPVSPRFETNAARRLNWLDVRHPSAAGMFCSTRDS